MKISKFTAALLAVFALTGTACAQSNDTPAKSTYGGAPTHEIPTINGKATDDTAAKVNYVTGGIGDDERAAIEAAKHSYNVYVMSASANGAFVEDTQVVITKKGGEEVLNVNAGPLLYVQLPTGSYVLEATHAGQTKKQTIVIGAKKANATVHLGWKVPATVSEE